MRRAVFFATGMLLLTTMYARPAEPAFSRSDIDAAYAMGRADAVHDSAYATPAARALAEKLKPAPQSMTASPPAKKP